MHLRRVMLLVGMVLLLTGIVVAIAPPRHRGAQSAVGVPPAAPGRSSPPRAVPLRFPPPERLPVTRVVQGDHLLVRVSATEAGDASVAGQTDTAEPGTPASFDLLAPAPGRYPVTFAPAFSRPRRIGMLEVKP
jgi:hypothetical protein